MASLTASKGNPFGRLGPRLSSHALITSRACSVSMLVYIDTASASSPIDARVVSLYCQPVNVTSKPTVVATPTGSMKEKNGCSRQVSYNYDSDEEEELGALIYQSSLKKRARAA